jgi:SagB-type dehydrogenase family enzyme
MMKNRDTQASWSYHEATKHSYASVRANTHVLDWANRPLPFKIYPAIEPLPLPRDVTQTGVSALSAIAQPLRSPSGEGAPDFKDLSRVLYFSAGITRYRKYPGGEIYFRAAACTGALYEIELYVVTGDIDGLDAGVYHFNPADVSLRLLRKGDYHGNLARATAFRSSIVHANTVIVCTGTYWRNAWKYQARTYRHFGWDHGTLLANMLAVSAASGLPTEIVLGFLDAEVNTLLDLDTHREVSWCLVPIGRTTASSFLVHREVLPLGLETIESSKHEVEYPAMLAMHEASSLESQQDVSQWSGKQTSSASYVPADKAILLRPLTEQEQPTDTIEQVVLRRGSSRKFDPAKSITLAELSTILDSSTRGIPADFLEPGGTQLNDVYLIVHAVDGLRPGTYFFHRQQNALELLKAGYFRAEAGYLGLEQQLPVDACVDVFFLANLKDILERHGNRGYRAVQLEAGLIGGKMYLAAYAQRLGATGLTFFDDDVIQFFSPHAKSKSAIFLLAVGIPMRRNQ